MTTPIPAAADLEALWMPFTANRQFKADPRLLVAAEGMHYTSHDGRRVLDAVAGLWCVNAGHGRRRIVEAVQRQVAEMDYAPPFQMGHPAAFELAGRLTALTQGKMGQVFFTNSGSESVDTALKIAIAYHRLRGEGTRTRLIGRERGYHGVGFGGISVGGIVSNRKFFGPLLNGIDHLPHTHSLADMAFSRGQPDWGAHLADELERIVGLHGPGTVAAVIVEPMAGSTGVVVTPKGYLKRLREICDRHGILLILDEVITGYGRLGYAFAAERYGILPDMITFAQGVTNGAVPMGGVIVRDTIYDSFMKGPDYAIELFHGYTYSAHPLACAAGLATLDLYREEGLFERARALEPTWADAVMGLRKEPNVVDIRTVGITAGIDLAPRKDGAGARGFEGLERAFHEHDLMIRVAGDTIALTPPLIVSESQIGEIMDKVAKVIRAVA